MGRKRDRELIQRRETLGYGDVLSAEEVDSIISRANNIDYLGLKGDAWATIFRIFWAFGKRISEIVELRVADVAVWGNELVITFTIRKKSRKSKDGVPIPESKRVTPPRKAKRLTLDNPYAKSIKIFFDNIVENNKLRERKGLEEQVFLFPRPQTKMKHIYPKYVWDVIQMMKFKQPIWTHLFRHTLATRLALAEVGAFEMKEWFDWASIQQADTYVSSAGFQTKRVSSRKW